MGRIRLDLLLTERGLAESRKRAQALILAGEVTVEGLAARKAGQLVGGDAQVAVRQPPLYVSRGGLKLAHALDAFGLSPRGLVAIDVGASTGGFTDVLLQRGARRVYAVDVGRGQLHWCLRGDARVVSLERTNARYLDDLPEQPELATFDVSFISLRLVVPPVRRLLAPASSMIVLVKPQFEAGRAEISRGGVVRDPEVHRRVLEGLVDWLLDEGLRLVGLEASPLRGPAGNVEFLGWLRSASDETARRDEMIDRALRQVQELAMKQ